MVTVPDVKAAIFSVVEEPAGGFVVCRNGVVLKTPNGAWLTVSTVPLAEAIAAELRAQAGSKPDPAKTPLYVLSCTAIDVVAKNRGETIDQLTAYASSELLCHRAEDPVLAKEQQENWQPLLDWCKEAFGAPLNSAPGIMPIIQPAQSLQALRRTIETCENFQLTGLGQAVTISGSLVLGLALVSRRVNAESAFNAAELDATHQMKKWGADPAVQKRREDIQRDLAICERWFDLLGNGNSQ